MTQKHVTLDSRTPCQHPHFEPKYLHLYLTRKAQQQLIEKGYTPDQIEAVARRIREGKV